MEKKPLEDDPPPKSTDLAGWRQAVEQGTFRRLRLEEIVAAIQDLGLNTENEVLHPLAKHLSECMMGMLRDRVGFHHPDQGWEIIHRVHYRLWESLLHPTSKDGVGLRRAFATRLRFRLNDAIIAEGKARSVSAPSAPDPAAGGQDGATKVNKAKLPGNKILGAEKLDGLAARKELADAAIEEQVEEVEAILLRVSDSQKRLAFRLRMNDTPYKSIAAALGITAKTAKAWVEEVQGFLKVDARVLTNLKHSTGGRS